MEKLDDFKSMVSNWEFTVNYESGPCKIYVKARTST
jgi:hypothetical protein